MKQKSITKETLLFLKKLAKNNNREWFAANKTVFKEHETAVKAFYEELKTNMETHDEIEKLKKEI